MTNPPKPKGIASVLVSPPAFDLDPYKPFNEEAYQQTLDGILFNESSLENSFDDYSMTRSIGNGLDGTADQRENEVGETETEETKGKKETDNEVKATGRKGEANSNGESTRSKYFKADYHGKVSTGNNGTSIGLEGPSPPSQSHDTTGAGENNGRSTNTDNSSSDNGPPDYDETLEEEDIIFSSIPSDTRRHILSFIVQHPFSKLKSSKVDRPGILHFENDIRRQVTACGMNRTSADRLIRHVRNVYDDHYGKWTATLDDPSNADQTNDGKNKKRDESRKRRRLSKGKETDGDKPRKSRKSASRKSDLGFSSSKNGSETEAVSVDAVEFTVPEPKVDGAKSSPVNGKTNFQDDTERQNDGPEAVSSVAGDADLADNGKVHLQQDGTNTIASATNDNTHARGFAESGNQGDHALRGVPEKASSKDNPDNEEQGEVYTTHGPSLVGASKGVGGDSKETEQRDNSGMPSSNLGPPHAPKDPISPPVVEDVQQPELPEVASQRKSENGARSGHHSQAPHSPGSSSLPNGNEKERSKSIEKPSQQSNLEEVAVPGHNSETLPSPKRPPMSESNIGGIGGTEQPELSKEPSKDGAEKVTDPHRASEVTCPPKEPATTPSIEGTEQQNSFNESLQRNTENETHSVADSEASYSPEEPKSPPKNSTSVRYLRNLRRRSKKKRRKLRKRSHRQSFNADQATQPGLIQLGLSGL